jgi:glycosyltransferase involved in cell wall biosynthesis
MPMQSSSLPAPGSRLRIHVWAQSFAANPGGIQTFTRFVVQGLRELYPDAEILVFAKNDLPEQGSAPHLNPLLGQEGEEMGERDREGAINSTRGACDPRTEAKNDLPEQGSAPRLNPLLGRGSEEIRERDRGGAINSTRGASDPQAEAKNDVGTTPHLNPLLDRAGEETKTLSSKLPAPSAPLSASSSVLPAPSRLVIGFGGWPEPLRAIAFAIGVIWHAVRIPRRRDDIPGMIVSTHVNFAPVGRLVKRLANVSFAAVGHGIEVWNIDKASVRNGLRQADQLIAVSRFTRTRMATAVGVSEERIEVLPNTFDSEKFRPGPKPAALLQRYGLSASQPIILTVARLAETEQYKGYDNVLLALPAVLQQFPDARYIIVGDGPDKTRLGALSRELGVKDKVIMAGYVPNEELAGHYNLCDVFVMPSKGEGFGIVFLEALGCGKPVIAGTKDASAEAVLNGKLGVMVDPEDVAAIADAICRILLQRSAVSGQQSGDATERGAGSREQGETAGSGQQSGDATERGAGSREQRAEDGGQQSGGSSQQSEDRGQRTDPPTDGFAVAKDGAGSVAQGAGSGEPITDNEELLLQPELLRREVIAAYGYERFRRRLGEIVERLRAEKLKAAALGGALLGRLWSRRRPAAEGKR